MIRTWSPAIFTAVIFVVVLTLIAFVPELCPAMESDSLSCGSSDRDAAAVVGMVAVGIVFAGGVVLAFIAPSARAPSIASGTTIALVIVGVVGSVAAILSSGFVIG